MWRHAQTVNRSGYHSEISAEDHWSGSNSASSSSSSHPVVEFKKYDLFINHRGPDTKFQFVTHLEEALEVNNISPFVDYAVEEGERAFEEINAAIQTAPVQLAIFSPNYASSSYCLNELVGMLDRAEKHPQHVTFLPVFFDVEPGHLRRTHLFGTPFHRAFQNHDSSHKHSAERISRWKKALDDAANFKGFLLSKLGGDTNKLKRKIVARVQEILNPLPPSPVGSLPKKPPKPDPANGQPPKEITFTPTDRPLRVLVLGDLSSVDRVVSHICGEGRRHTQVQDHVGVTESRSSSPPMSLFYSSRTNGSDRENFKNVFKAFIENSNSRSRARQVVNLCLDVIYRRRLLADPKCLLPGKAPRLHMVWYVCRDSSDLPDSFHWEGIMRTLSNIPLQVVVTAAPGAAKLDHEYEKIFKRLTGFFPKAQEPELEELVVRFDGSTVEELWRKCWQAKTRAEIGNAARVIRDVRQELGDAGVAIPSQGVGNAAIPRKDSNSLSLGGELLRQFFCEYWEVSNLTLIHGVLWETTKFIEQTPERKYRYRIQAGQFVKFCLQVAAIILHNARDGDGEPRYVCDWPNSSLQALRPGIVGCDARYFQRADRTYDRMKFDEIQALLLSIFERRDFNFDHLEGCRQKPCFPCFP